MDYLWTPWRFQYISQSGNDGKCVFCAAAESQDDRSTLVAYRSHRCLVILNRFPYTSGHVMVVPYDHVATLEALSDETLTDMILTARAAERHLRAIYRPDGLNLGMNIGRSAGAGIAGHVHLHVLPRWTGDTNFMTVTAETRVLPEELETTWERIRAAFAG